MTVTVIGVILTLAGVAVWLAGCVDAWVIDPGEQHAGGGPISSLLAFVGLTEWDAAGKYAIGLLLLVFGGALKGRDKRRRDDVARSG